MPVLGGMGGNWANGQRDAKVLFFFSLISRLYGVSRIGKLGRGRWTQESVRVVGGKWLGLTDVRHDAGHDDLRLVRSSDSRTKIGAVPGVDFAIALDQGRVWVHVQDLLREGTIGTCGHIRKRAVSWGVVMRESLGHGTQDKETMHGAFTDHSGLTSS